MNTNTVAMAIVIREGILVTPHRLSDSLWEKDVSVNWTKGGVQKEGYRESRLPRAPWNFSKGYHGRIERSSSGRSWPLLLSDCWPVSQCTPGAKSGLKSELKSMSHGQATVSRTGAKEARVARMLNKHITRLHRYHTSGNPKALCKILGISRPELNSLSFNGGELTFNCL